MPADAWTIGSTVFAGLSAAFAGIQIWLSRRDANRRATLDYLREVETRSRELLNVNTRAAQAEILRCYREPGGAFSANALTYVGFLNTLDLFAFAEAHSQVDRTLTRSHLRTLLRTHVVSLTFLGEFQQCCKDPSVYEHLTAFFKTHLSERHDVGAELASG